MSITGSIKETQKIVDASKADANIISANNNIIVISVRTFKVQKSNVFNENKFKLKMFLIQTELYIDFNLNKFNEKQKKILWTSIYFRDETFDWIDIYVRNFIDHKNDLENRKININVIFLFWNNFKAELNRMYENIDAIRIAERKLNNFKQIESTTNYAAKFQQYAAKTDWNYDSQKTIYWIKLKDRVKNALILSEKSKSLIIMITKFIEIDNDQYEKKLKKKNENRIISNRNNKFHKQKIIYSVQMKLDTTHQRLKKQGWKKKRDEHQKNNKKDKFKIICYECELAEHYKRNCKKKQLTETQKKQFNVISRETTHDMLHWTACYDDECQIHFSDKDGGFFPKKPENKRIEPKNESWERLDEPMDRILCESSDSEQWKPVWENKKSAPRKKKAWEITHDFVFEKYSEKFRFSKNKKNSNSNFRNWEKRQRIKKKMQQKKHEKFSTKQCKKFDCRISHKSAKISVARSQPRWINLVMEQLPGEKAYITEKEYWMSDGGYISSKLRETTKKLTEEYMACKSQGTSKN